MKQAKEIEVVEIMIKLYCHNVHKTKKGELCDECGKLLDYVKFRRSKCPFGDDKPFCSNCRIHCYKPDMREQIRQVMRYSGPRMIFGHPYIATKHLVETKKEQKKIAAEIRNKEAQA